MLDTLHEVVVVPPPEANIRNFEKWDNKPQARAKYLKRTTTSNYSITTLMHIDWTQVGLKTKK